MKDTVQTRVKREFFPDDITPTMIIDTMSDGGTVIYIKRETYEALVNPPDLENIPELKPYRLDSKTGYYD